MKTLRLLLATTLLAAAAAAQAVPVNAKNLKDFRAYTNTSCLKHQNEISFCTCTDEKVGASFRAASWETGTMSSQADKNQVVALHSAAMNQCTFEMETSAFIKEQTRNCQQNAGQIPPLAKLDTTARASACECVAQKVADAAYGTDSTQPVKFNKTFDMRSILGAAIPACTGSN